MLLLKKPLRLTGVLAAVLLLSACGTPQQQAFKPDVKQAVLTKAPMLVTGDDAALPVRAWIPKKPKAIIIALHGFNDYGNAFTIPAQYLTKNNIAVLAYDQRGFGTSPNTGLWAGVDNLTSDLADMVNATRKSNPNTPIYVLGESMGGAVSIAAVSKPDFPKIDGLILSSPAIWGDDTMSGFYRVTLWVLAHMVPSKPVTGSDLKILASDNIPMLREMSKDPLVIKQTRIDAVYGLVHLMDNGYEQVPNLKTPVLLLYGAKDQVIPPLPIKSAATKFSSPLKIGYYPRGYHMLLRDLSNEKVLGDIVSWISNPHAPLPSGFETDAKNFSSKKSLPGVQTVSTIRPMVHLNR